MNSEVERQTMEVDIACVGFGPATGGFLTTLNRAWNENPGDAAFESKAAPGMPLQVLCYERADDLAAGVSGVVTRAEGIRSSFPALDPAQIPMAVEVKQECIFYLLDPIGASKRSFVLRAADALLDPIADNYAFELPWIPSFLHKRDGLIFSIGQFNQWVASQLMSSGLVQIWPGMPVTGPLFDETTEPNRPALCGIRLADQGVDKSGAPIEGFMPGMDVRARLTVVGDGPVGAVGRVLNRRFKRGAQRDWALGMKFVIELPEGTALEAGTVWHTFGFPEPEIFGFLYVHPDRLASVGIFVPSWFGDAERTAYRYLQHYIQHPLLWQHLKSGTLRSWGAKSLDESGRRGEPVLTGDGFARIGEGSGSTNVLTNSGVDEAWTTGVQLGEAVLELLRAGLPFTRENLASTYERRRKESWVEQGACQAEFARDGFHAGFVRGMIGVALAGLSRGLLSLKTHIPPAHEQIPLFTAQEKAACAVEDARAVAHEVRSRHDVSLSSHGWPEIAFDGRLLVTQQDALLVGGKVQAMPDFADHVRFVDRTLCAACVEKTCVAMCSGQAITAGPVGGVPVFEREKCVYCGACLWNCPQSPDGEHGNIEFVAGSGGLHSAEN